MDPTERFAELVAGPPDVLPLDEAVLLVAAHDHAVDIPATMRRLDELAARCSEPSVGAESGEKATRPPAPMKPPSRSPGSVFT